MSAVIPQSPEAGESILGVRPGVVLSPATVDEARKILGLGEPQ